MRSRVLAYLTLPHFTPLAIVVVVTGFLAWIIAGASIESQTLARMLMAALGGQLVVGVVNDIVDAEDDRLTKPDKSIPSGLVSERGAAILGVSGLVLMVIAGATFGLASFLILLVGTGTGVAYSIWFKKSRFAWLPYLVALPLLPIWVAVTLDRFEPALLLLFPLGALAVLGVQVAQSVPDIEEDRAVGIESVTTRLGERRTLLFCWATILASMLLTGLSVWIIEGSNWPMTIASLIVVGLVVFDVILYRTRPRSGVMAAFPCIAGAVATLALAWVGAIYR